MSKKQDRTLEIELDLDRLLIGDLRTLFKADRGDADFIEALDILDKITPGVELDKLNVWAIQQIMERVILEISGGGEVDTELKN